VARPAPRACAWTVSRFKPGKPAAQHGAAGSRTSPPGTARQGADMVCCDRHPLWSCQPTSRPRRTGRRTATSLHRHAVAITDVDRMDDMAARSDRCRQRHGTAGTNRRRRAHSTQRDAPAVPPSRACRTPGLNSPVWVPNWGSALSPEPPDANRPLDPQAREPSYALKRRSGTDPSGRRPATRGCPSSEPRSARQRQAYRT
jgi:hypothetical protein